MIKISKDVPKFIIEMLSAVDYSKITDAHYDDWIKIIKLNIGKHLKLKKALKPFVVLNYPIRQDLYDLINRYDFSGLTLMKIAELESEYFEKYKLKLNFNYDVENDIYYACGDSQRADLLHPPYAGE